MQCAVPPISAVRWKSTGIANGSDQALLLCPLCVVLMQKSCPGIEGSASHEWRWRTKRKKPNQTRMTYQTPSLITGCHSQFRNSSFLDEMHAVTEKWEAWRSRKQPDCIGDVGDRLFLSELWWFSSLFYMRKLEIVFFGTGTIYNSAVALELLLVWWDVILLRIRKHTIGTWDSESKPTQYKWYHGSFWSTWTGGDEKYSV